MQITFQAGRTPFSNYSDFSQIVYVPLKHYSIDKYF